MIVTSILNLVYAPTFFHSVVLIFCPPSDGRSITIYFALCSHIGMKLRIILILHYVLALQILIFETYSTRNKSHKLHYKAFSRAITKFIEMCEKNGGNRTNRHSEQNVGNITLRHSEQNGGNRTHRHSEQILLKSQPHHFQ